jgi:S1-C subfamily serine protease
MRENFFASLAESRASYLSTGNVVIPVHEEQVGYYYSREQLPNYLQQVSASVGKLINTEGQANGSCFLITDNNRKYLVSAQHTFSTEHRVTSAVFPTGETVNITEDEVLTAPIDLIGEDICLLRRDDISSPGLTIGDSDIQSGESVLAFGYPRTIDLLEPSTEPLISVGIVLETDIQPGGLVSGSAQDLILTSARAQHGNSGGPLVDANGKVRGIVIQGFIPRSQIDTDIEMMQDVMRMVQELAPRSKHESLVVPIDKVHPHIR